MPERTFLLRKSLYESTSQRFKLPLSLWTSLSETARTCTVFDPLLREGGVLSLEGEIMLAVSAKWTPIVVAVSGNRALSACKTRKQQARGRGQATRLVETGLIHDQEGDEPDER